MTIPTSLPVRVRCLDDGQAALTIGRELGRPVLLLSDPGAAGFAGAGWWAALTDALAEGAPDQPFTAVLDCADAAGSVQAALRAGVRDVAFSGDGPVVERLRSLAAQHGARLHRRADLPTPVDLRGVRDRLAHLRRIGAENPNSGEM